MTAKILLLLSCALGCSASTVILCSTGETTASGAGCGLSVNSPAANNLTPDGNWFVASGTGGVFQSQAFVTVNNSLPLQAAGPWLANDGGSAWLTPGSNQATTYIDGSFTYFAQTFGLTAGQLANVVIKGSWLADDYAAGIFLNGAVVPESSFPLFGGEGGPMVPFTITQGTVPGEPMFVTGSNTIVFAVENDASNRGAVTSPGNTPTGVRILITEADSIAPGVPEPATFGLLMGGFGALLLVRRRRK